MSKHNPERKVWKGRSYKKGGEQITALREKSASGRKLHRCDGCGKDRADVKACGRDANGDPDAPDLCFICRKEGERRRIYDSGKGRYVSWADYYDQQEAPF